MASRNIVMKKTKHVVMISFVVVFGLLVFWIFQLIRSFFQRSNVYNQRDLRPRFLHSQFLYHFYMAISFRTNLSCICEGKKYLLLMKNFQSETNIQRFTPLIGMTSKGFPQGLISYFLLFLPWNLLIISASVPLRAYYEWVLQILMGAVM